MSSCRATNAKLAARLDEEAARRLVRTWPGRVVRLVTLSEQLRRAKKRIAELETAIKTDAVTMRGVAFALGVPSSYHRGRADERAAVVGWLRRGIAAFDRLRAEYIKRGEHVKGAP